MRTAADPDRHAACAAPSRTAPTATRPGAPTSRARRTSPPTSSTTPARIPRLQDRYGIPTDEGRLGLSLARVRRALRRREAPQRAQPLRLGGRVRSVRSRPASRSSTPRWAAWPTRARRCRSRRDGRVVYYMGDDDYRSKFEHIYKFVSAQPLRAGRRLRRRTRTSSTRARSTPPASTPTAAANGSSSTQGKNGLTAERGFAVAGRGGDRRAHRGRRGRRDLHGPARNGSRCIRGRKEVYVHAEQQHVARQGQAAAADRARWAPTPPIPRAPNLMGHIIRWREAGGDPARHALRLGRLPAGRRARRMRDPLKRGNVKGGVAFAQPGRLLHRPARRAVDPDRLVGAEHGDAATGSCIGNNQMLAADPSTGEVRRFLTGPGRLRDHRRCSSRPTCARCSSTSSTPARRRCRIPGRNDPDEAEGDQLLARRRRGRAAALGDDRHPAQRRRHRRHLRRAATGLPRSATRRRRASRTPGPSTGISAVEGCGDGLRAVHRHRAGRRGAAAGAPSPRRPGWRGPAR